LFSDSFAPKEEKHIEEKHHTKIYAKPTDFIAQALNELLNTWLVKADFKDIKRKSQIHQVESDAEKIISRMGYLRPAGEDIIHVHYTIFEKHVGDIIG